eukprot:CAMPEP_0117584030 /NCGR_PEP_ID=MMETSP0784-20121206/67359_1 /TAXON_ID=39447 /ORGANISM="" /LENGTH=308 /DNA_ID=CAMNT_0005384813 /DNA_START=46 /DNA_END=969 /DNA_ORIENTATION=+
MKRYMSQAHENSAALEDAQAVHVDFKSTDWDRDGKISRQEFDWELQGRQKKPETEAQRLWDQYHDARSGAMTEREFRRLARTGFDVVAPATMRSDFKSTISAEGFETDRGFWGPGATCPAGEVATGAQLKRMLNNPGQDNTGLNALRLKCGSDPSTVINSTEGPDGEWSGWLDCPAGHVIYGVRLRSQILEPGRDNSGINDLEFMCRAAAAPYAEQPTPPRTMEELRFAGGPTQGGWSPHFACSNAGSAVCGAQVRLRIDQDEGDDMGVTDMRLFCCGPSRDCHSACEGISARFPTAACTNCKRAAGA